MGRDFCNKCFPIVCREVFNKANDGITVEEVKETVAEEVVEQGEENKEDKEN